MHLERHHAFGAHFIEEVRTQNVSQRCAVLRGLGWIGTAGHGRKILRERDVETVVSLMSQNNRSAVLVVEEVIHSTFVQRIVGGERPGPCKSRRVQTVARAEIVWQRNQ